MDIFQTDLSLDQLRNYLMPEPEEKPPLTYLIQSGSCRGEILEKSLKVVVQFNIVVYQVEWIQLLHSKWVVTEGNQKDYIVRGDGQVLPRRTGLINVELSAYVTGDRNSYQLWFPVPLECHILLHKRDIMPIFSRSLQVEQDGREVTGRLPGGEITFSWSQQKREKKPVEEQSSEEMQLSIVDETTIIPGYRRVTMESTLRCQVEQGGLFQVTIPFKEGKLLHLTGGAHYKVIQGKERRIEVHFNRAITGTVSLTLITEYATLEALKPLMVIEARRQTGFLVVRQEPGTIIEVTEMSGGKRSDLRSLPDQLKRGAILAAYRWFTPYTLSLKRIDHTELPVVNAVVEGAHTRFILSEQGRWLVSVKMRIKNGGLPFLKLTLPEGASILSAFLNNKAVKPVQGEARIMLPILRSNSAGKTVTLEFSYLAKIDPLHDRGEIELPLGQYDLPINRYFCSCFLPDQIKYDQFKGDLDHVTHFKEFIFAPPPQPKPMMPPMAASMTMAGGAPGIATEDRRKSAPKKKRARRMEKELQMMVQQKMDQFDFDCDDECEELYSEYDMGEGDMPVPPMESMEEQAIFDEMPVAQASIPPEPEPMMKQMAKSSGFLPSIPTPKISRKRGMKRGVLPVKVELETEGEPIRFQRFWVTESIRLKWRYRRIHKWFSDGVKPLKTE